MDNNEQHNMKINITQTTNNAEITDTNNAHNNKTWRHTQQQQNTNNNHNRTKITSITPNGIMTIRYITIRLTHIITIWAT